jgi:hypothetical protein
MSQQLATVIALITRQNAQNQVLGRFGRKFRQKSFIRFSPDNRVLAVAEGVEPADDVELPQDSGPRGDSLESIPINIFFTVTDEVEK